MVTRVLGVPPPRIIPEVVTPGLALGVALADTQRRGASAKGNLGSCGTARVTCSGTVGASPMSGAVCTIPGGKTVNGSTLDGGGAVVVAGATVVPLGGLPRRFNRSSELVD